MILVALFALAGSVLAVGSKGSLHVEIAFQKEVHNPGDAVLVDVNITNTGKGAARILRWFTAQNGVEESLFDVRVDGNAAEYVGRHYKRPEPSDMDYIVIQPGRTITATVDLADYYDMTATGMYSVRYAVESFDLFSKNNGLLAKRDTLTSSSAASWVDGRHGKKPQPPPPSGGLTSFTGCTATQANSITSARTAAANYSQDSRMYLAAGLTGPRYTTWFGVYSSSRYNTVLSNFVKIDDALDNAQMNFNCGCKQNYYAYVYPNQPYNIYVCRVFWQAPTTGTDSKAGTIIHETSHFNVVAGTDDIVYGQTGARNLANSDPNRAVQNADSHEYFAENSPKQN
jgi:peptidyl-Lys metalloendopeptidase